MADSLILVRPLARVALGVALALASLELAACFVNPVPPDPHETADEDPLDGGAETTEMAHASFPGEPIEDAYQRFLQSVPASVADSFDGKL